MKLIGALLLVCSAPLWGQQARQNRSCVIHVDSVRGGTQFLTLSDGTQNVFAGGGVWARCVNEPTTITSDSFQYFQSAGQAQFIGRVHFQDSASVLDADRITRGRLQIKPSPILLSEALIDAVNAVRPRMDLREQTLTVSMPRAAAWPPG